MKQPLNLVVYRDEPGQPILYFGPYPNPNVAQFFKANLPEPLEGGLCRVVTIQPFTSSEGHVVHEKIIRERQSRHSDEKAA